MSVRHVTTTRVFRVFRNHYLCPCTSCDNEWSDLMMVVGPSFCPACDAEAEPYDHEALLEDEETDEDDEAPVCPRCGKPMVRNAWPADDWFCEECDDYLDPDRLREDRDDRLACLREIGGED